MPNVDEQHLAFSILLLLGQSILLMDLVTYQQQLRTLLTEGKTEEALEQMLELYEQTGGRFQDELVVIAGEWQRLEDQQIAGVLDSEDIEQKTNVINYRLIQLISNLDEDQQVAEYFGATSETDPKNEKRGSKSILMMIGLVLVGIVIAYFIFPIGGKDTGNRPGGNNPIEIQDTDPSTNAVSLPLNESLSGRLANAESKDQYSITVPQNGRLTVFFDSRSPNLRVRMNIYDSQEKRILQHTAPATGADFEQTFSVRADTYTIVLNSYRSNGGSYAVKAVLE
jgi:hypothetical protein